MQARRQPAFVLHGAFTGELSQALLTQLPTAASSYSHAELIVEDGTRIFYHSIVLQRLSARGLDIRVARPIRVLALTMNPYTPEYVCTPQHLLDVLVGQPPPQHPPTTAHVSPHTR